MLQLLTKKSRGFTLIELLVVIAIIGILSSIVLVSMSGARKSARDATRKADMRQMVTAEEMYNGTNDQYSDITTTWPTAIGSFMPKTPTDPTNSGNYVYKSLSNSGATDKFCFYATLEGGGYYTASHAGNFFASTTPTLANCGF